MRINCKTIIHLFGLLTLGVSAAIADEPKFDADFEVETYYTSNLYHVAEDRKDQFDTRDGPNERFHDMVSPDDFVTRPGLDLKWEW